MFNGNLKNVSIFKLIKNPAVLLIHKFSTEHTELVNQQIIMKTTIEWVIGYLIRRFGGLQRLNLKIGSKFPKLNYFYFKLVKNQVCRK